MAVPAALHAYSGKRIREVLQQVGGAGSEGTPQPEPLKLTFQERQQLEIGESQTIEFKCRKIFKYHNQDGYSDDLSKLACSELN